MEKEEIISVIGKPILNPLGVLQMLSFLALFSTPFIWIWISFGLALKVFLSSLIAILIITKTYKFIENCISESIENEIINKPNSSGKSKFQQKLDEVMEKKKQENKK